VKNIIIFCTFLVISILSSISTAQNNPQIRICRQLGGEFVAANTDTDQIGLCRFGQAYIGSIDLVRFVDKSSPDSIETYTNNIQSCEPYAQTKQVQILQGPCLNVCVFSDGSIIESQTLSNGRQNFNNAKLNKALNL
jgi:putative hemolysin